MDFFAQLADFIFHIDIHLDAFIQSYGAWTYALLFAIIFFETGVVVTPFLPGDTLLFAAGAFAARGSLNPILLTALLSLAAALGDTLNYWVGKTFGERVRFLNKNHLARAHGFYEKYGGKTIIFARFIPIIRTFAPFVAGIGKMNYLRFLSYNIIGGVAWVLLFTFGGFFFGNLPAVRENFTLVIAGIIFASILPAIIETIRRRTKQEEILFDADRDNSGKGISPEEVIRHLKK